MSANLRPYDLQLARKLFLFVMGIQFLLFGTVETSVLTFFFFNGLYNLPISFWSPAFLNVILRNLLDLFYLSKYDIWVPA